MLKLLLQVVKGAVVTGLGVSAAEFFTGITNLVKNGDIVVPFVTVALATGAFELLHDILKKLIAKLSEKIG